MTAPLLQVARDVASARQQLEDLQLLQDGVKAFKARNSSVTSSGGVLVSDDPRVLHATHRCADVVARLTAERDEALARLETAQKQRDAAWRRHARILAIALEEGK